MLKFVSRQRYAPSLPESNYVRKRRRYLAWLHEPALIQADLQTYKLAIASVAREATSMQHVDDEMNQIFHILRCHFRAFLHYYQINIQEMQNMKAKLCECISHECYHSAITNHSQGIDTTNHPRPSKKGGFSIIDALETLKDQQEALHKLLGSLQEQGLTQSQLEADSKQVVSGTGTRNAQHNIGKAASHADKKNSSSASAFAALSKKLAS